MKYLLSVTFALVAVLSSGISLGLHSDVESVGHQSATPTTIYYSEHSPDSQEEHLHAEIGFESILCLACSLSLRDKTALEGSPGLFDLADNERSALAALPSSAIARPLRLSSPRAPPRA